MGKRFVSCLLLVLLIGLAAQGGGRVQASGAGQPDLIRLHVSANSESLDDMQIKLIVRDQLLAQMERLLLGVADRAAAAEILRSNLSALLATANAALEQAGADYSAKVQFGTFNFPDKHYGTFTLPAGRYQALNVTLGEGAGRNWWCVVFPQICLTNLVCSEPAEAATQTIVLRCKVAELWEALVVWVKKLL